MALPRKFLNEDEELLAELQPHWVFLFGPLFTSIGTWAAIIAILIVWHSAPGWTNYPFLILALLPGLWLLGRFIRWRSYVIALTSTRILVRQGILGRDTVQLRLQRITEVNISQTLIERLLGTGRIIIDVQGEDDSLTLEYVRKPAVVQRVINSQINEIVGGGRREAVPDDMLPSSSTEGRDRRDTSSPGGVHDSYGSEGDRQRPSQREYDQDTPPFGVEVHPPSAALSPEKQARPDRFEIRDRLIELDDLRRRGIISEEEFASKKSELLNRI
jgi:membrane protein YdbS with pleckstrin-like domain